LFSISGLFLENDESLSFICKVLEGVATVPIKNQKSFDFIATNVFRLFTYVGGGLNAGVQKIHLLGELAVTSKRLILINDLGFFVAKPAPVLFIPLDSIVSISLVNPVFPFSWFYRKGLVITFKIDQELAYVEFSPDSEINMVRNRINEQINKLKQKEKE